MREVDPATGDMPNATAWLVFDQTYWDKFGIFGITPGGEVPDYLHRADTLSELANDIGVDEAGLRASVKRFNTDARQARDPQFQPRRDPVRPLLRRLLPPPGQLLARRRFPAATAKARQSIAALIGPVVNKLAGGPRAATTPRSLRSVVVGPLARIIRPVLDSPRSSVLGPVDTAPYYALKVEASALGTVGGPGPTPTDVRWTPRARSSPACTPRATPAALPPRASTAAPAERSPWAWSSDTWPGWRRRSRSLARLGRTQPDCLTAPRPAGEKSTRGTHWKDRSGGFPSRQNCPRPASSNQNLAPPPHG